MVAASGICVGAAGVALKCHLKGKSAHHLLTKCRKGDLVVKCHLRAKCAHPWHAERRKGDLVDRCHPSAKSGHPWLVEPGPEEVGAALLGREGRGRASGGSGGGEGRSVRYCM